MPELMNQDHFRSALENAIQGRAATKAPFSVAWASGKLSASTSRAGQKTTTTTSVLLPTT
jgi:hypothetical protein